MVEQRSQAFHSEEPLVGLVCGDENNWHTHGHTGQGNMDADRDDQTGLAILPKKLRGIFVWMKNYIL